MPQLLQQPRHGSNQKSPSTDEWTKKTGARTDAILAKEKKDTMPRAAPQMSLELITRLVGSQKEKDTYRMMSLIGVT